MEKPTSITAAFVELDTIPDDDEGKKELLMNCVLRMLYAFEGKQVRISVELTPVKD